MTNNNFTNNFINNTVNSNNEINKRIKNVLKRMNEKDYDGMIMTQFNNIKYISNYSPTSFAICLFKEDPIIFTTAMDKELADETSLIEVKEFKSIANLKEVFKKEGLQKIAVEGNLPLSYYKKLEEDNTSNENWDLSIETFLEKERMVKSNKEIGEIKKATDIAHKSFEELDIREKQENRVKDWEIAYELRYLMRDNGANQESFETIVATGPNTSLPHATIGNKELEDIILMDWGAKYNGYCSDTSRTMIDDKNEKEKEVFDIVLEAYKKTINGTKAGLKACEIDNIARSVISEYGYGDKFIHSTGHSLGLNIHETPSISKKDETFLEENMVITIEPGIYLEGELGVRIEDAVIVGKNSVEIIGKLPYHL